ncbi:MAG: sulfotransferase family 2 domain-containing protein [Methylovulum sp.]
MESKNYYFIHMPKTAGTSFRRTLEANELVNMIRDYGVRSPESNAKLIQINPEELAPENEIFDSGKVNFICGHVDYLKYAHCFSPEFVVSIVRNPIERIVSEYQHLKRHGGFDKSFSAFYLTPVQQNKQSGWLKGLNLKEGGLIGLTSHYKYFVELFSNKAGFPMEPISVNNAPVSDIEDRFNISPKEIKGAYRYNQKDIEFFFKCVKRFVELVQGLGYNTIPPKNIVWSCRIDNNKRVIGWVPCTSKDCYFIVISVNGIRRVVVSLDQPRMDVYENNLSENPVCGFSYPLSLLGVEQGDEISVGLFGAPWSHKKLSLAPQS